MTTCLIATQSSSGPRTYATAASQGMLSPAMAVTPPNSTPGVRSLTNSPAGSQQRKSKSDASRTKQRPPHVELDLRNTKCGPDDVRKIRNLMDQALKSDCVTKGYKCLGVLLGRQGMGGFVFG